MARKKTQKKRIDAMYKATPSQKGLMKNLWGTSKKKMRSLMD